jgi:excisionase family DNA binding protein
MNTKNPDSLLPEVSESITNQSLLTVDDVARYLQLTPETIRSMARHGKLTGVRLGRVWRFDRKILENDMLRFMNLRGEPPVEASDED